MLKIVPANAAQDLEALPGNYAPPGGVLLLARDAAAAARSRTGGDAAGCVALYRDLGFREIAPYLACPTPDAICFELRLS